MVPVLGWISVHRKITRWTHNHQWLLILAIAQSNSGKKSCLRSCKKTFCGSTMLELTKNRDQQECSNTFKKKKDPNKSISFFEITHLETTHKNNRGKTSNIFNYKTSGKEQNIKHLSKLTLNFGSPQKNAVYDSFAKKTKGLNYPGLPIQKQNGFLGL
jgi:hypothetical protein